MTARLFIARLLVGGGSALASIALNQLGGPWAVMVYWGMLLMVLGILLFVSLPGAKL